MTTLDWVIFVAAWSLVPAVLLLKAVLDFRQARAERECWSNVADILKGQ